LDKNGKRIPKGMNVYNTLIKTLQTYPYTKLYIWGAGDELVEELVEAGHDGRFVVCSHRATPTRFEQNYPHWYKRRRIFLGDDGQDINQRHKGDQTRDIIEYFMRVYHDKFFALVRGNNPRQQNREHTSPINISRDSYFLGFHPTYVLTEEEVRLWVQLNDLPDTKKYFDWLKKAGEGACGIETTLVWEHTR
jgi:hypothetical protein